MTIQHRPPVKRLFNGMAGSALATVDESVVPQAPGGPPEPPVSPLSGAERARRFRERHGDAARKKDARRKADARAADLPTHAKKWNRVLAEENLDVNQALYDADGKLLVSGGYDSNKIAQVASHQDGKTANRAEGGGDSRRVVPAGNGGAADEDGGRFVGGKKGVHYVKDHTPRFIVKMDAHQFHGIVSDLIKEHFEMSENVLCCELCGTTVEWHKDRQKHIEEAHGSIVNKRWEDAAKAYAKKEREAKKAAKLRNEQQLAELRKQAKEEGWGTLRYGQTMRLVTY
jgi:hypothetical protein